MGHGPAWLLMEANGGFGVDSSPASIGRAGRLISFLTRRVGAAARQTIPYPTISARFPASGQIRISKSGTCSPNVQRHALAAEMFVENNDEQRRGWFLSYSVRLWRGRIGTVALPLVDFLQRSSHERCFVVLGQAFGVAERHHRRYHESIGSV